MATVTQIWGYLFLGAIGVSLFGVSWAAQRFRLFSTLEEFLVANRRVGTLFGAFSIASTWIWAPALFISSQIAYQKGYAGLFWFWAPNVLTLVLFAFFADSLRRRFPSGYTLPEWIRHRFGARPHKVYIFMFLALQVCSTAVQLIGGAAFLSGVSNIPYVEVVLILSGMVLAYSLLSGMKADVITDFFQMSLMLAILALIIPWTVMASGGLTTVWSGIYGIEAGPLGIFDLSVLVPFGIITALGLLAGPIADQQHWQRAFAVRRDKVRSAFLWGAFFFGLVPLSLSFLGFIAAANGWKSADPQMIGSVTTGMLLPHWAVILYGLLLLVGLTSTQDSCLVAASSIYCVDIHRQYVNPEAGERELLKVGRRCMLAVAFLAVGIAMLPGIKILYLFLFYGTLRTCTLVPTLLSIYWRRLSGEGVFWGVSLAALVGLPVHIIGGLNQWGYVQLTGTLLTIVISTTLCLAWRGKKS